MSIISKGAVAAAAIMALGLPTAAHADAIAFASSSVKNAKFYAGVGTGGPQLSMSNFSEIDATDTVSAGGALDGVTAAQGYDTRTNSAAEINTDMYCLGNCNAGWEDMFTRQNGPASWTRSDSRVVGSGLAMPGATDGVTTNVVADTRTVGVQGVGNSDALNVTGFKLNFTLGQTTAITFAFEGMLDLYTQITDEDGDGPDGGESAQASNQISFSIVRDSDGVTVFEWTPDGNVGTGIIGGQEFDDDFDFNRTQAVSTNGALADNSWNGLFSVATDPLMADVKYTASLIQKVNTLARDNEGDVTEVTEPATLALLGFGLVGIGALRRRRKEDA